MYRNELYCTKMIRTQKRSKGAPFRNMLDPFWHSASRLLTICTKMVLGLVMIGGALATGAPAATLSGAAAAALLRALLHRIAIFFSFVSTFFAVHHDASICSSVSTVLRMPLRSRTRCTRSSEALTHLSRKTVRKTVAT